VSFQLEYGEPISILVRDSIFDHTALSRGLIGVKDLGTGELVDLSNARISQNEKPSSTDKFVVLRPGGGSILRTLSPNQQSPGSSDIDFFLDIGSTNLKPSTVKTLRRYRLEYQRHGIFKWFCGSQPPPEEESFPANLEEDAQLITASEEVGQYKTFQIIVEHPRGPPLQALLRTSSRQLNLSGQPPFTAFIDWKLEGSRKICILLDLDCRKCMGIVIHDPASRRRRAPQWDQFGPEYEPTDPSSEEVAPDFRYGFSDRVFLRIGPGDVAQMSYTLTVEKRQQGFTASDMRSLTAGEIYVIDLRHRKCRWMYEDELPRSDLDDGGLRQLLSLLPESTIISDCSGELTVVGEHLEQRGLRDYGLVDFKFHKAGDQ
jgi:hypothetical protein